MAFQSHVGAAAKQTFVRLADWGIRVVGIAEEVNPPVPCRYRIRRGAAISRLLEDWKLQVGEPITIVRSESRHDSSSDGKLLAALKELQIRYESVFYTPQNAEAFVRRLIARETAGIIFGSSRLSSLLSFRAPDALTELLRTRRVAFADGPVNMPFAELPDLPVDLVTVDWRSFAKGLVNDLITQEAFDNATQTAFEAELHLRVPLRKFAQEI